jgi:hypothetical protein
LPAIAKVKLGMTRKMDKELRLVEAARRGDIGGVRAALADGAKSLPQAARAAAAGRELATANYLLDCAERPSALTRSLLLGAAASGCVEVVDLLIRRGAGITPNAALDAFWLGVERGRTRFVEFLLDSGLVFGWLESADATRWTRMAADLARDGQFDLLRLLFERGAPLPLARPEWRRLAQAGRIDIILLMIQRGASPPYLAFWLPEAVRRENIELVRLLLRHGADPNDPGGDPLLPEAARLGNIAVVDALLDAGARRVRLAMNLARENNQAEVAVLLEKRQRDLDERRRHREERRQAQQVASG